MKVLGIDVDDTLVAQWCEWYAPEVQPFFVDTKRGLPKSLDSEFTPETEDSFRVWSPANRGKKVVWFDEATAREAGLPFRTVSAADVVGFVDSEGLPHHPGPNTPTFAGTFPTRSGPNCFGAVIAAADTDCSQDDRVLQEPFEEWLHTRCKRGGRDDARGTVLVWRETDTGLPFHAAITIGEGMAFEKPSQCWWTPWYVAPVADIKRVTRMRGIRLERWRLTNPAG